jgi:hypothetical protein
VDGAKEIKLQSSFNKSEYDMTTCSLNKTVAFIFGAIWSSGFQKRNWRTANRRRVTRLRRQTVAPVLAGDSGRPRLVDRDRGRAGRQPLFSFCRVQCKLDDFSAEISQNCSNGRKPQCRERKMKFHALLLIRHEVDIVAQRIASLLESG